MATANGVGPVRLAQQVDEVLHDEGVHRAQRGEDQCERQHDDERPGVRADEFQGSNGEAVTRRLHGPGSDGKPETSGVRLGGGGILCKFNAHNRMGMRASCGPVGYVKSHGEMHPASARSSGMPRSTGNRGPPAGRQVGWPLEKWVLGGYGARFLLASRGLTAKANERRCMGNCAHG